MNRRDRKREKHRLRRQERRKELRLRRERESLRPKVVETAPQDLRGLSAIDWSDLGELTFERVTARAREMYPKHRLLKLWLRGRTDSAPWRDQDADELKKLLTHAARTLRSDPPWHWPHVSWDREGDVVFYLTWKRRRLEQSKEHGRVGFWDLSLPDPHGRMLDIGFSRHAIERFTERLVMHDPVPLRALADVWMLFLGPYLSEGDPVMLRQVVERDGQRVLTVGLSYGDRQEELGCFPLEVEPGGLAVATTFLEPWMSGPEPAVKYSEEERERFRSRFLQEVVPWVRMAMNALAFLLGGRQLWSVFLHWLQERYKGLPTELAWMEKLATGATCFSERRYREAQEEFERGFAELSVQVKTQHPFLLLTIEDPKIKEWVAAMKWMFAQTFSLEAVGGLFPGQAPPPADEAERLLARGRGILREAIEADPELLEGEGRNDPDVQRLLGP